MISITKTTIKNATTLKVTWELFSRCQPHLTLTLEILTSFQFNNKHWFLVITATIIFHLL